MRTRMLSGVVLAIAAMGCSDGNPTGPQGPTASFNGGWVVSFDQATGGGERCRLPSMLFTTLNQADAVWDASGLGYCLLSVLGSSPSGNIESWPIGFLINYGGDSVVDLAYQPFQVQPPPNFEFHMLGHLSGDSLVGIFSRSVVPFPGAAQISVLGTWHATRVPEDTEGPSWIHLHPNPVIVTAGDSVHLADTAFNSRGEALPQSTSMLRTVSDPTQATISADGWLHTTHPGDFIVSARAGSAVAEVAAVVTTTPESLHFTTDTIRIYPGGSTYVSAVGFYAQNGSIIGLPLTFTSSDTSIAVAGGLGYVGSPGTKQGQAWIRAEGLGFNDSVPVIVAPLPPDAGVRRR